MNKQKSHRNPLKRWTAYVLTAALLLGQIISHVMIVKASDQNLIPEYYYSMDRTYEGIVKGGLESPVTAQLISTDGNVIASPDTEFSTTAFKGGYSFATRSIQSSGVTNGSMKLNAGPFDDANYTISMWINTADICRTTRHVFYAGNAENGFGMKGGDGEFGMDFYTVADNVATSVVSNVPGTTLEQQQWVHVSATVSLEAEEAVVRLYKNGEYVDSGSVPASVMTTAGDDIYLGGSFFASSNSPFYGFFDEVSVFDEALTDAQIQYLYYSEMEETITFQDIKGDNTSKNNITEDLKLITVWKQAAVSWVSSNPSVIDADTGSVTRGQADEEVTLTATLEFSEDAVLTQEILVTVKKDPDLAPLEPEKESVTRSGGLLPRYYFSFDETADGIERNITEDGTIRESIIGASAINAAGGSLSSGLTYTGTAKHGSALAVRSESGTQIAGAKLEIGENGIGFSSYTVSLWAYMNDVISTDRNILSVGTAADHWQLGGTGSYDSRIGLWTSLKSAAGVSTDTTTKSWYHYTVVVTGSPDAASAEYFVNGVLIGSENIPVTLYEDGVIYLGSTLAAKGSGSVSLFNGMIDEVKIYDAALTSDEVKYLYYSEEGSSIGFADIKGENIRSNRVTKDLKLPSSWNGAEITWESDNEAVINSATGAVTRAETDQTVRLTATMRFSAEAELKQEIQVTVLRKLGDGEPEPDLTLEDAQDKLCAYLDFNNFSASLPEISAVSGTLTTGEGISGQTNDNAIGYSSSATSNYITLSTNLIPSSSNRYTISVWVKPTQSSNSYRSVFNGNRGSAQNITIGLNGNIPQVTVRNVSGDRGTSEPTQREFNAGQAIEINEWSLLTFCFGGGTGSFYVNGRLVSSMTDTPYIFSYVPNESTSNITTYLGGYGVSSNTNNNPNKNSFVGYMDDLYLYEVDLGAAQVAELYNQNREDKITKTIRVSTEPVKKSYSLGEELNTSGMKAEAYYYGVTEPSVISDYEVIGFNKNVGGTQSVVLAYDGCYTSFEVNVGTAPTGSGSDGAVKAVYITRMPEKNLYYIGEEFDTTGMKVVTLYENGAGRTVENFKIAEYSNYMPGWQMVKVSVDGILSDPFLIEVCDEVDNVTKIEVVRLPDKTNYFPGEKLDLSGLEVMASYRNGNTKMITPAMLQISGFHTDSYGKRELQVTYSGVQTRFSVNVIQRAVSSIHIVRAPNELTYYMGETFDKTGMLVKANYNNGETELITGYSVRAVTTRAGRQTVSITYGGKSASFTITVLQPKIRLNSSSVTLYTKGSKTHQLKVGQREGPAGAVTWTSSNPKVAGVTNGVVTAKKAGTVTITVKSGYAQATCKITVKKASLKLKKSSGKVKIGKKLKIKATAVPSAKITYQSMSKKIATVSSSGVIKGRKKGQTTIKVKANGIVKKFKVKVRK